MKQSIPLLTLYKIGRFNLSHRYVLYVIYALLLLSFLLAQNLNPFVYDSGLFLHHWRDRDHTKTLLNLTLSENHSRRSGVSDTAQGLLLLLSLFFFYRKLNLLKKKVIQKFVNIFFYIYSLRYKVCDFCLWVMIWPTFVWFPALEGIKIHLE